MRRCPCISICGTTSLTSRVRGGSLKVSFERGPVLENTIRKVVLDSVVSVALNERVEGWPEIDNAEPLNIAYGDEDYEEDDYWADDEYEYPVEDGPEVPAQAEFEGTNHELAQRIAEGLLAEGEVDRKNGRKAVKVVAEILDSYPVETVNGREQNVFRGTPDQFANEVAEGIRDGLEKKGLLARLLRR